MTTMPASDPGDASGRQNPDSAPAPLHAPDGGQTSRRQSPPAWVNPHAPASNHQHLEANLPEVDRTSNQHEPTQYPGVERDPQRPSKRTEPLEVTGVQSFFDRLVLSGKEAVIWKTCEIVGDALIPGAGLAIKAAHVATNILSALKSFNEGQGFELPVPVIDIEGVGSLDVSITLCDTRSSVLPDVSAGAREIWPGAACSTRSTSKGPPKRIPPLWFALSGAKSGPLAMSASRWTSLCGTPLSDYAPPATRAKAGCRWPLPISARQ